MIQGIEKGRKIERGRGGGLNLREYVVHHEYGGPRYYTYHSRV